MLMIKKYLKKKLDIHKKKRSLKVNNKKIIKILYLEKEKIGEMIIV